MEIFQLDDDGALFVSSDIDDWSEIASRGIGVVVDMDGSVDAVPEDEDRYLYVYYPIPDLDLPNLDKLHAVARLVAGVTGREKTLVHCQLGYNRSCLVAGLALTYLGMTGAEAMAHVRAIRSGALFNEVFAEYLETQPSRSLRATNG